MLADSGFEASHETSSPTDIVVVNTCGFIGDAKEESVNTILEQVEAKNLGHMLDQENQTPQRIHPDWC